MHSADIQARLKKKGITQRELARQIGVSANTVSTVLRQTTVSDRIMRAIATAIGMAPHAVFPYYSRKQRALQKELQKLSAGSAPEQG